MKRVLVCSPQEYIRESLKSALAAHLTLIVTEDAVQGLAAAQQKASLETAFIDIDLIQGDHQQENILPALLHARPELKIIAVAGERSKEDAAVDSLRSGAAGYIVLPADANAILTLAR